MTDTPERSPPIPTCAAAGPLRGRRARRPQPAGVRQDNAIRWAGQDAREQEKCGNSRRILPSRPRGLRTCAPGHCLADEICSVRL